MKIIDVPPGIDDGFLLRNACYLERLCKINIWLKGSDGAWYRPEGGWPIAYAYGQFQRS